MAGLSRIEELWKRAGEDADAARDEVYGLLCGTRVFSVGVKWSYCVIDGCFGCD